MFVKALLSVETITACLKAKQHFYSRVVLRRRRLLKTLRIPMPTSKRFLDNDKRGFQVLVALSSDHILLFASQQQGEVDHAEFGSFPCCTQSFFSLSIHFVYFSVVVIQIQ